MVTKMTEDEEIDLIQANQKLRRQIREAAVLLQDVDHMITHGRISVAREYIDRAQQQLAKANA
jgi:hypothetical protein